jgi:hypothetical protein
MQNFDPQEFEKQQKQLLVRTKISLYITVGWGLVALFLMVGLFVNRDAAVLGMLMVAAVWVQLELLSRAGASLTILKNWKALTDPPKPGQNDTSEDKGEEE